MTTQTLTFSAERRNDFIWRPNGIAILGLLLAFWPVWRWYVLRLDDGSDEPMGLLALAAAAWFLWQQRDRLAISENSATIGAVGLIAYAILFPYLPALVRAVAALAVIGTVFRLHRAHPGIWGLLLLSLPVIATAQFYAGWPLRLVTAAGSEGLLRIFGMEVERLGTVLWWNDTPVGVDAPCSGIRMLWTGLFIHFVLALKVRCSVRRLFWLTAVALIVIIGANVVRATGLFFKESGAISLPEWTHEGMGLVVFMGVIAALSALHRRASDMARAKPEGLRVDEEKGTLPALGIMAGFSVAAGVAAFVSIDFPASGATLNSGAGEAMEFPGWPEQWEGRDLVRVPLSESESAFAENFPGKLSVFRTTEGPWSRRLILRWVTRPTRKLHSSFDCFRAAGFSVEAEPNRQSRIVGGENWSQWIAVHPQQGRFRLRERIWESDSSGPGWAEVSAWFWDTSLGRSDGPWWAVTVMEPES